MLGEKLREARVSRGLSLSDVAEQAEISPATLSRIECDKQGLHLVLFLNLARILDRPASDFFDGDGGPNGNGNRTDPIALKIASMNSQDRIALWQELSKSAAGSRKKRPEARALALVVEELLAHMNFLCSEIEGLRNELKRSSFRDRGMKSAAARITMKHARRQTT